MERRRAFSTATSDRFHVNWEARQRSEHILPYDSRLTLEGRCNETRKDQEYLYPQRIIDDIEASVYQRGIWSVNIFFLLLPRSSAVRGWGKASISRLSQWKRIRRHSSFTHWWSHRPPIGSHAVKEWNPTDSSRSAPEKILSIATRTRWINEISYSWTHADRPWSWESPWHCFY